MDVSRYGSRAWRRGSNDQCVGGHSGVAVLATVLSEEMKAPPLGTGPAAIQHAQLFAYHVAFASSIVFGLLGIIFALRIHDEDAVSSMG